MKPTNPVPSEYPPTQDCAQSRKPRYPLSCARLTVASEEIVMISYVKTKCTKSRWEKGDLLAIQPVTAPVSPLLPVCARNTQQFRFIRAREFQV